MRTAFLQLISLLVMKAKPNNEFTKAAYKQQPTQTNIGNDFNKSGMKQKKKSYRVAVELNLSKNKQSFSL